MRCAQFQRLGKTTSTQSSTSSIKTATSKPSCTVLPDLLRQPSSNLLSRPSTLLPTSSADSCSKTKMIRRSQRECTKNQSLTSTTNSVDPPMNGALQPKFPHPPPPPHSSAAATSATTVPKSQGGTSSITASASSSKSCSAASAATTAAAAAAVAAQLSEAAKSGGGGGGRHPHPPNGSNAKLKHKCPFDGCPWRFATPYKLRRHIKSHTKETPYLCKECGRGFSVRYNLLMHIQTIHSQPQKYKCPMRGCKDAFHSQSRLNGHLRRIHKKDWKSLQSSKDQEVKSASGRSKSVGSLDGATPMNGAKKQRLPSVPYKCPHCIEEFSSKVKLGAHIKLHAPEKAFKCTVQGCDKCFSSQEKLDRHTETHKNSKQFCCPHKNCNRIFLRQTHLRNHLKIHTQDHQFICPVLDCSEKFASESAYNVHLNTHINYGYNCPYPGCDQSFLSRKRLAIHTQVVHNMLTETGICSPLLDGIQPHLGMTALHSPTSPSYMAPPPNHALHASKSCVLDKDFIRNVDLPGLSADDIEAVLSENEDWSGEQIDQFLRSAVDLSEIESKLFSLAGYESDSGYSTYDVSPMTSTAPSNMSYNISQVPPSCPPPPLTLINHSTSPLFGNPAFPGMHLPHHPTPSPLLHEAAISPCGSDGGFFSPHSSFGSLANTPNQDTIVFFPPPGPIYSQPYSQSQDYNNNGIFSINNSCFTDSASAIPNFSLQIPDIILHDVNTPSSCPQLPPSSLMSSSDVKFSSCSHEVEGTGVTSEDETALKKEDSSPRGCAFEAGSPAHSEPVFLSSPPAPPALTSDVKPESSVAAHCAQASESNGLHRPTGRSAASQYRYSASLLGSLSKKGKTGNNKATKTGQRKRKSTQWPRSMNRANLMAFREHILNKLKKAQEVTVDSATSKQVVAVHTLANQGAVDSKRSTSPPAKFEASSPNPQFELQVTYERNHVSPPKRCHSEPARLQNMAATAAPMQASQSNGDLRLSMPQYLNDLKLMGSGAVDCGDMFSELSCNPDTFLSATMEEKFLSDLELKFNMEAGDEGEIFYLLDGPDRSLCPSSSSLSEVEAMDMDCIQDFLDYSKEQVFSPSSSTAESPSGSLPNPEGDNHTPSGSTSSPASLSRSNSTSSMDKSTPHPSACHSPGGSQENSDDDHISFKFPEILSIHGSMVLDGVSVLSDEEASPDYQPQHAFLRSHHDPLLAADSLATPPSFH